MSVIYLLLAFIAAVCIGWTGYIIYRMEELDEIKECLDRYSINLDERANRLALWEDELRHLAKIQEELNKLGK